MSLLWAGLVVALAVGVAVSALLLVRRRAPDGSFFADGDRAAGVFGVLATGPTTSGSTAAQIASWRVRTAFMGRRGSYRRLCGSFSSSSPG